MISPNPAGRPSILTQQIIERVLDAIPKVIVPQQVAYYSMIPPSTLRSWLEVGLKDIEQQNDSIYAQFSLRYYKVRSEVLQDKIERLGTCPKNYGALTWILEKCFREEFEEKSAYVRMLEDVVFDKLPNFLGKGNIYGKEANTELYQAASDTDTEVKSPSGQQGRDGDA